MDANDTDTPGDSNANDAESARAARLREALQLATFSAPVTLAESPKLRQTFIRLLADGLTVSAAARRIGVVPSTIAHLRRRSEDFDIACTEAIEIASEAVLERLRNLALTGNGENLTTVRAAEIYLKGTNRRYQLPDKRSAKASITRRDLDGTEYTISASANGIPD